MAGIEKMIANMARQIAELQRAQANVIRSGRVVSVDAGNQRVKVDVGNDGNPLGTPWIRWTERAGARKTWNPPSVGELMTVLSPAGDIDEKSLAVHGGFTGDNGAPSGDGDATVYTFGAVTITTKDDGSLIEVGGVSVHVSSSGIDIVGDVTITGDVEINGDLALNGGLTTVGATFTHNGVNIGATHRHSGIEPGPSNTGTPN